MNPFDNVSQLFTEDNVKVNTPYMVNRILSFLPETCMLAIRMNRYTTRIPQWAIDACYNLSITKRRRRPYIRYPKRRKVRDQKLQSKIQSTFNVNEFHAKQIIELLRNIGEKPENFFGLKKGE